jgi:hypothetical protein
MRNIINRKIYDTETAELIFDTSNRNGVSDFGFERSGLYRTTRGAWFLAGNGGPMSRFSRTLSDRSRTEGSGCIPLTPADALSELERHNAAEEIDCHLSTLVEEA